MLTTIWDDIDNEIQILPISKIDYNGNLLIDNLYNILNDRNKRRTFIKKNKSSKTDIKKLMDQKNIINNDIENSIVDMFKKDELMNISSVDKIFINVFYRKILRSKLELDFKNRELIKGLIITKHDNWIVDYQIVSTLRILRIICNYLGIESTIDEGSFSISKLEVNIFWVDISNNVINLFGENTLFLIDETSTKDEVLFLLNIIFDKWSGTILTVDQNMIIVKPALYVKRLVSKLKIFF